MRSSQFKSVVSCCQRVIAADVADEDAPQNVVFFKDIPERGLLASRDNFDVFRG